MWVNFDVNFATNVRLALVGLILFSIIYLVEVYCQQHRLSGLRNETSLGIDRQILSLERQIYRASLPSDGRSVEVSTSQKGRSTAGTG